MTPERSSQRQTRSLNGHSRSELLTWSVVALLIVGYGLWHSASLPQFPWKYDEGIYVQEALLQLQGNRLYLDIWSERPPMFSWMLAGAFAILGPTVAVGRLVVLVTALVAIASAAIIARCLGTERGENQSRGRIAAVAAAILLIALPHFHGLSARILIELPPVTFALLAIALILVYQRNSRITWLILSSIAFAISLLIKPVTAPMYGPLCLLIWQGPMGNTHEWKRSARDWMLYNGIMAAMALLIMLYYGPAAFMDSIVGTLFAMRGAHALSLSDNWVTVSAYFANDKWGLAYPWLFTLAALGWIELARRQKWWHLLVSASWLGLVIAALMLHTPIRRHHLFLLQPVLVAPAAVAIGQGLSGLGQLRTRDRICQVLTIACLLTTVWCTISLPELVRVDIGRRASTLSPSQETPPRQAGIDYIQSRSSPDQMIICDDPMLAFMAERPIPPLMAAPSYKRVQSGEMAMPAMVELTESVQPELIAFWEGRMERSLGYEDWVQQRYALGHTPETGRRIYIKPFVALDSPPIVTTNEGLAILGVRARRLAIEPGDTLQVDLLLRAELPLEQDYAVSLNVLDLDGVTRWGQSDVHPLDGTWPGTRWTPGLSVMQPFDIDIAADATSGPKLLTLSLYGDNVSLLTLLDGEGNVLSDRQVTLGIEPVIRWPAHTIAPAPQNAQQADLGGLIRLVGYDLPMESATGAAIPIVLYWQCKQSMVTDYTMFVHMLDARGELVAQGDARPSGGQYPTTGWVPNEYITDAHAITLPDSLPSGEYSLAVGLYELQSGQRLLIHRDGQPTAESHITLKKTLYISP